MLGASQLRRRMEDAVLADSRYQAVDAAKKKAVAQRCDVETFQALVSAAHLRPMRSGTGLRIAGGPVGKPPAPRCIATDGSIAAPEAPCVTAAAVGSSSRPTTEAALRSGAHWVRAWRASPAAADRLCLLARASKAGVLARLLRLELSTRLLEEILSCLQSGAAATPVQQTMADGSTAPTVGAVAAEDVAGCAKPSGAAAGTVSSELAAAVLQAMAGARSYAVAKAGLSLQNRELLECLAAAHKLSL